MDEWLLWFVFWHAFILQAPLCMLQSSNIPSCSNSSCFSKLPAGLIQSLYKLNLTSLWISRSKTNSLFLAKLSHAFCNPFVTRTVTNLLIPSCSNFLIQAQFHQLEPKTEKLQEFASSRHTMTITDFIGRDFYLWTPNTIFILFLPIFLIKIRKSQKNYDYETQVLNWGLTPPSRCLSPHSKSAMHFIIRYFDQRQLVDEVSPI